VPEIRIHSEISKCIRPLTTEERKALEESLRLDGCREPLAVWPHVIDREVGWCKQCRKDVVVTLGDDVWVCEHCGYGVYPRQTELVLLDGHNRLEICRKRNIHFEVVEIDSVEDLDEARAWVIRNQLARRNLTESQRAMYAVQLEEIFAAQAKKRMAEGGRAGGKSAAKGSAHLPTPSVHAAKEAAAAAQVSPRTVQAAKKVKASGTPKLQEAVRSGQASVSAAAEVARLPARQQDKIVAGGPKAIAKAAGQRRRQRREGIARDALKPIRGHSKSIRKKALELPHDPVAAARTLVSVFDTEFLRGLVRELSRYLKGDRE